MHHYNVETLSLFDAELEMINSKPEIKKIKGFLNELKHFKVQTVLDYKKRNDSQI